MKERPVLFTADAVADADGVIASGPDACVLVDAAPTSRAELPVLLAVGQAARLDERAAIAERVERPGHVILPGLVNAHTHLDLTHIGPRPHDPEDGFVKWVDMVRSARQATREGIAESVRAGIQLNRRGGTLAIGDIAGAPNARPSLVPGETLSRSGMLGVSYAEFFAIGKGAERGVAAIEETVRLWASDHAVEWDRQWIKLGLQPHAPNTVGLTGYRRAIELAKEHAFPVCTHLAETWEEREFIGHARGGQRELLERFGLWDDAMLAEIGRARHPVEHLRDILASAPITAAHVNDADDAAIDTLARSGASVVYCPRASAYFGADRRFGPHRYRDMLAAGIPVALGTDSIINLDTPDRISVLDEMRLLFRRDGADPLLLLRMATVNGAIALGLNPDWFRLRATPGPITGLVAVPTDGGGDFLARSLTLGGNPEVLLDRKNCCETGMERV